MSWRRARLRDASVLARCDGEGNFQIENGRVEIRYRRDDGRAYQASPANLVPEPDTEILPDEACAAAVRVDARTGKRKAGKSGSRGAESRGKRSSGDLPVVADGGKIGPAARPASGKADTIIDIYTDGACTGNPGPAGLGVVIDDGSERRELSVYLGQATNNKAELSAIAHAARAVAGTDRPVRIHTDSQYCIGVLTRGWKARANTELVAEVRAALAALPDVRLQYVQGHAGHEANERADELARQAIVDRHGSGG